MFKKYIYTLILLLCTLSFTACSQTQVPKTAVPEAEPHKLNVVCTIFPAYDFIRQIARDQVNLTLLLKPGSESHSFEPSPKDIEKIQHCDLFIYVGGDSDAWVDKILQSQPNSKLHVLKMMSCVPTVPEEIKPGMQLKKERKSPSQEEAPELDEHVWTSPANAMQIVQQLAATLSELDKSNQAVYAANTKTYLASLEQLDKKFQEVVKQGRRKEIVVGDRFPFRYFCKEFKLSYYAAYPGCSTDTEASAATLAFLIDKIKQDHIPVVFHIELSNQKTAQALAESTGAKNLLFHAVHNVSADDFKAGATYLSLMEQNVNTLKEALN